MTAFPADAYGNPIPLMAPVYGSSLEAAVTISTGAAMAINSGANACVVKVFAIGCPCFYKSGTSGVALPTVADGFLFQDTFTELPLPAGHTHVRVVAKSGTGFGRAEFLG